MKIVIIGGNGTIGKKVTTHFKKNNDVIVVGRNSGDFNVDITNVESIIKLFELIGKVNAIINIAGDAKWDDFDKLTEKDYYIGIKSKLMGQVNLVRIGKNYLHKNGTITLSTGILADYPVVKTASAAMVNGGIHSFVKAVALELNYSINAVSLGLVEDAYEKYKDYFLGHNPISMQKVVNAYEISVQGKKTGEVIKVYN